MFQTILVPLDGSRAAECALPLAESLAQHTGATLRLVRVLPDLADRFFWAPLPGTTTDADLRQHYLDQARGYLQRVAEPLSARGLTVLCDVVVEEEEGVAESIRRDAVRTGANLVVMINQRRGVLGRFWYGSVAADLFRSVRVPVLLIPTTGFEEPRPEATLRHILVALDGTPDAELMLEPALEMARAMGADLTLVRVVPPAPEAIAPAAPAEESSDSHRTEACRYLDAVAERLRATGVTVQTRLLAAAEAAKGLIQSAVTDADLLALETPERHGLDRLLHRSVVEKVVHDSIHPVLVLRQPGRNLRSA
jgi:nucleotide-binding universal stress UspA family protein